MLSPERIPFGHPYGDIYSAATPNIDRTVATLQSEDRARQQYQLQQDKGMDNLLSHEFTKVRSEDTPDVIDKYNNYKQIKKKLLFDKNLQRNPKEYNKVQQLANSALADVYSTINSSAELKERNKQLVLAQREHPERFANNFGEMMTERARTPMSKLSAHPLGDLSNDNTLAYNGPLTDFSGAYKKAEGDKKNIPFETTTPDGLQRRISIVTKKSTPFEYYNNLLPQLVGSQKTQDFIRQNDKYTQQQEDDINTRFDAAMQDPEVKRKWGLTGQEQFATHQNPTPVERLAQLHAKEWALGNLPEETGVKYAPIISATDAMKIRHQKAIIDYRQGNTVSNIYLRDKLKKEAAEGKSLSESTTLNDLVTSMTDEADKKPDILYGIGANKVPYKELPVSTAILKLFPNKDDKGHNVDADKILISKDSGHLVSRTYARDENGEIKKDGNGNPIVDEKKTRTFTMPEFKAVIGHSILGAKETNKQLGSKPTKPVKLTAGSLNDLK